jgi:hypothetical protein
MSVHNFVTSVVGVFFTAVITEVTKRNTDSKRESCKSSVYNFVVSVVMFSFYNEIYSCLYRQTTDALNGKFIRTGILCYYNTVWV